MAQYGTAWIDTRADTSGMLRDIDSAARQAGRSVMGVAGTVAGDIARTTAQAAAGVTALGAAAASSIISVGTAYNTLEQTSRAAMSVVLGSTDAAAGMMSELREFAKSSPFPRQAFIQATQQMLAFGVESKKVVPTLDAIQDAVAAAGGGGQQILEVADIFSKVTSTGKITAETLNQLGYRGIDAAKLIAEGMGTTASAIREQITDGALDAGKALDVLVAQMTSSFGGAAEKVKETWVGATDRIRGAWRDISGSLMGSWVDPSGGGFGVEAANALADALRAVERTAVPELLRYTHVWSRGLADVAKGVRDFAVEMDAADVADWLGRADSVVAAAVKSFEGLEGVAIGAGVAIAGLGARTVLGPLGFLVPAISPITGVLGGLVAGSEKGRDMLKGLGTQAAEFAAGPGRDLVEGIARFVTEVEGPFVDVLEAVATAVFDFGSSAVPVLVDGLGLVGPAVGDLLSAGGELVSVLSAEFVPMFTTVAPAAFGVFAKGVEIAADAVKLLADNAWLLVPALSVFAAAKLTPMVTAVAGLGTSLAGAARDAGVFYQVLRAEGRGVTASLTGAAGAATGVRGALSALNPVVLGLAATVGVGFIAWKNYSDRMARVKTAADGVRTAIEGEADALSSTLSELGLATFASDEAREAQRKLGVSMADVINAASKYRESMADMADSWTHFAAGSTTLDDFRSDLEYLEEPVRRLGGRLADLVEAGKLDMSDVTAWMEVIPELADGAGKAIDETRSKLEMMASDAAASGKISREELAEINRRLREAETPAAMQSAFEDILNMLTDTTVKADEAVEAIDRLMSKMDELAGGDRSVTEAQRNLLDARQATLEAFAGRGEEAGWKPGVDLNDAAGRRRDAAIQRQVEAMERLVDAAMIADPSGERAVLAVHDMANELRRLREAGMISDSELTELLSRYDLADAATIEFNIGLDAKDVHTDILTLRDEVDQTVADLGLKDQPRYQWALASIGVAIDNEQWGLARDTLRLLQAEISAMKFEVKITPTLGPLFVEGSTIDQLFGINMGAAQPSMGAGARSPMRDSSTLEELLGIPRRAGGGPTSAGKPYWVGELGPELFVPSRSGTVIPADVSEQIARGGDGASMDALAGELRALRADVSSLQGSQTNINVTTEREADIARSVRDTLWLAGVG